jgi:hypothetical protein
MILMWFEFERLLSQYKYLPEADRLVAERYLGGWTLDALADSVPCSVSNIACRVVRIAERVASMEWDFVLDEAHQHLSGPDGPKHLAFLEKYYIEGLGIKEAAKESRISFAIGRNLITLVRNRLAERTPRDLTESELRYLPRPQIRRLVAKLAEHDPELRGLGGGRERAPSLRRPPRAANAYPPARGGIGGQHLVL